MTAAPVSERDWQRTLVEMLDTFGWTHTHTYPLRTQHGWRTGTTSKGFPDLLCVRGPWVLGIEAKTDKGRATPEQLDWLARFAEIPTGRGWLLRPSDNIDDLARWLTRPGDSPRVHGFTPRR